MAAKRQRRRFAPLNPEVGNEHGAPQLRGIIFDVDGTLCLPQNYMFREMRAALDIPKSIDILDHIKSLSSEPDTNNSASSPTTNISQTLSPTASPPDPAPTSPQARAVAAVKAIERNAMTSQRPQPGLPELMAYLEARRVRKALCTRNFPAPVLHLLQTYLPGVGFEPVITRETEGVAPKPSPEGLWLIARAWGLDGEGVAEGDHGRGKMGEREEEEEEDVLEVAKRQLGSGLIMVGDSIDDMKAGRRAGAATVLLANDENQHLVEDECTDLAVRRLDDIIEVLDKGFESRPL